MPIPGPCLLKMPLFNLISGPGYNDRIFLVFVVDPGRGKNVDPIKNVDPKMVDLNKVDRLARIFIFF